MAILELIHAMETPTGDGKRAFIRSKPIGWGVLSRSFYGDSG